jgi:hypothetical protein
MFLWIRQPLLFALGVVLTIGLSYAQSTADFKVVELPTRQPLGHYNIVSAGMPARNTVKEEKQMRLEGRQYPRLPGGELQGTIAYPQGLGLWVTLGDDGHGKLLDKLNVVRAALGTEIHVLLIGDIVDLDCLKVISEFKNLRDFASIVDQTVGGPEASFYWQRLKELKYLHLALTDSCAFGSTRFCHDMRSLPKLEYLSIPAEKLTDDDVEILANHPPLKRLQLRARQPVHGPKSLRAIQEMMNLKELFIVCTTDIRDADVLPFAEMRSLECLNIATKAPLTCQEPLAKLRPDCEIYFLEPSNELP